MPYAVSWSGGKDSALALVRTWWSTQEKPKALLTMMIEDGTRSRSHGLRKDILEKQAAAMEIPILFQNASWDTYDSTFRKGLKELKNLGVQEVVFGDICIPGDEDWDGHRKWADEMCSHLSLEAIQPLWASPASDILEDFFASNMEAKLVACEARKLAKEWVGQTFSPSFVQSCNAWGVHPLGERGEFHTVLTNCPLFSSSLKLKAEPRLSLRAGYWHMDFELLR